MAKIIRGGQPGNAGEKGLNQGVFRAQLAALTDVIRQLGGNPEIGPGPLLNDPLSAPYVLYWNPYIGSDRFVGGSYSTAGSAEKRIELQRLECGYTAARPFKTLNRAIIEAGIITAKSFYQAPLGGQDLVTIVAASGARTVLNGAGSAVSEWSAATDPTDAQLQAFNPTATGGVILPRGCSLVSLFGDLRNTIIRPDSVPSVANEAADYSNRRAILKATGRGYYFGLTFMDKVGYTQSHHLLDCFQFASQAELDEFYAKIVTVFGGSNNVGGINPGLATKRNDEYQIVGPIDQTQSAVSAWDTTVGASPYIFNCSVRSDYGMGGAFMDGARVQGLKSMVCANFTSTNLQKDLRCWQVYEGDNWVNLTNMPEDYQTYITADPDNLRRDPLRQTRHISAINNAYIQKVSIFGIGQSEVTMADSGGEITDNGGNSTFGGCSALAKGYKTFAFNKDKNWTVSRIRVPLNLSEKSANIRRIELGVVASVSSSAITLTNGLAVDSSSTTNPAILQSQGYSLAANTRVWIENPNGADWRATLSSSAWSSSASAQINITAAPLQSGTNETAADAVGRRVYIRRLVDTRTVAERRVSVLINNTSSARTPQRNTVLQTDPNRSGGGISRVLAPGGEEVLLVTNAGHGGTAGGGVTATSELTLRRGAASRTYASGTYYRLGTVVKHANKHWQANSTFVSVGSAPDPAKWAECFVHMPEGFNPEDSISQEAPILVLDTDTSDDQNSTTLGIDWLTEWTTTEVNPGNLRDQYRSGTDYLGAYGFLRALGFSVSAAHAALVPQAAGSRDRDPSSSVQFPTAPAGGAATGRANWAVEFRRPSTIRLYNHQWEWAGFGNYSKAMPAAQQDMSEANKFTFYFTSAAGGRVIPKGSNEDGYEVTPKGLEDIATGATISPESVGSGASLDDVQRTDFPNGLTASEITVDRLTVRNVVDLPDIGTARTTQTGPVQLASYQDLASTAAVIDDDQINQDYNKVITLRSLNRWKLNNGLVSARSGVQRVFVDPASTRLTSISALLSDPPLSADKSVPSLAAAAAYANEAYGPTTTVEFRCGPGVYLDKGEIVFKTIAIIGAWDYSNNTYLNDNRGGGSGLLDPDTLLRANRFQSSNFYDPTKQPIFLTDISGTWDIVNDFFLSTARPLRFTFEQVGQVTGVCWWGVMTTITNSNVPDSFFRSGGRYAETDTRPDAPSTNWRKLAQADPDNALNYWIKEHVLKLTPDDNIYRYYGHRIGSAMHFYNGGEISNVAIGALAPSADIAGNVPELVSVIRCTSKLLRISGLRLVGNCKISSEVNTLGIPTDATIRLRTNGWSSGSPLDYFYTGWAIALIGFVTELENKIAISFGSSNAQPGWNGLSGTAIFNQPWNNLQLLKNDLTLDTSTTPATPQSGGNTGWKNIGPSLASIIGYIGGTVGYSERNWRTFRVNTTLLGYQGIEGKFGLYTETDGNNYRTAASYPTTNTSLIPRQLEPFGYIGTLDTNNTIVRVAGTGARPAVDFNAVGLTSGDVGDFQDFDDLNMRVRGFKRGIDTTEATNYFQDFIL